MRPYSATALSISCSTSASLATSTRTAESARHLLQTARYLTCGVAVDIGDHDRGDLDARAPHTVPRLNPFRRR